MASLLAGTALALSGRVIDADSGEPLSGVEVQAYDARLDGVATLTGSDGAFSFSSLADGRYRLRAVPPGNHATRFHPDARDFCDSPSVDADTADLEFSLPPGASLQGAILDSAGSPMEGATVWALGADTSTEGQARSATVDTDGGFEIIGLDPPDDDEGPDEDEGTWAVGVDAEGWPWQYLTTADPTYDDEVAGRFAASPQETVDIGTHALLDGIAVSGTVTGPAGTIADATVHVYAGGQVTTVLTDKDGRYDALGLPPGDVLPWVSAAGHALTYWPDVDRPTSFLTASDEGDVLDDADLFPPAEGVAWLAFVDETGAPVPDVQALLYNDTRTVGLGDVAEADGVLALRRLSPGDYTAQVWADGIVDGWITEADGGDRVFTVTEGWPDAPVTVTLPPDARLSGVVRDTRGTPIYGATVLASSEDDIESAVTDHQGAWEIAGLPAGEWAVEGTVTPFCDGDPGFVTVYLGAAQGPTIDPAAEIPLTLEAGQSVAGLALTLPPDDDHDAMDDLWEVLWGLDPTRDDSGEDPDADGVMNLEEYRADTDPMERRACGGGRALALPLLLLAWRRR